VTARHRRPPFPEHQPLAARWQRSECDTDRETGAGPGGGWGIDDLVGQAKGALAGQSDKVEGPIDKIADLLKDQTDDSGDAKVDEVADKIKDFIPDKTG